MAVISKGIKLSYGTGDEFTLLTNLQEIPQIGGTSEAIEITTLEDVAHMYTNGILNYGDSLSFKFLYEKTQFTTLANLGDDETNWKVELPDGAVCNFKGTASVALDSAGVNVALTYSLAVKPTSTIIWA